MRPAIMRMGRVAMIANTSTITVCSAFCQGTTG